MQTGHIDDLNVYKTLAEGTLTDLELELILEQNKSTPPNWSQTWQLCLGWSWLRVRPPGRESRQLFRVSRGLTWLRIWDKQGADLGLKCVFIMCNFMGNEHISEGCQHFSNDLL